MSGVLAANLGFSLGGTGAVNVTLAPAGSDYSVELRVRFPLQSDTILTPTELSGALWTVSSGSSSISAWYEKSSVGSTTGNLYVTSSFGKLQLTSVPLFDDRFYNVAWVSSGSSATSYLSAMRYDSGELELAASVSMSCAALGMDLHRFEVGSSALCPSRGQFWAQEVRFWSSALSEQELTAHAIHFESYGRDSSLENSFLEMHLRLNDGVQADASGSFSVFNSVPSSLSASASGFVPLSVPFQKFLEGYSYIPSIDYGWNQKKVRVFDGSSIDPFEAYHDERHVSLEFNMYDALNEDISHVMTSYDELNLTLGLPVNRYREEYEGLQQMRETYFKRLQGPLNFRVFADMLDFFDSGFSSLVERLLPARSDFKGDEMIVESHMLERPKYQYQLRPVTEGLIDISGSIAIVDRWD